MKSTDDALDNALRNALKQRLDDFEAMPSDQLSEKILGTLSPARENNRLLVLLLLLLSFGTDVWLAHRSVSSDMKFGSEKIAKVPSENVDNAPKVLSLNSENRQIRQSIKESTNEGNTNNYYSARQLTKEKSINSKKKTGLEKKYTEYLPANPVTRPEVPKPNIRSGLDIQRIAGSRNFLYSQKLPKNYLTIPVSENGTATSMLPREGHPSRARLIFSFTPINTFQHLTILPQPEVRYRNFELPSSFSSQTLGYNLQSGMEKNGFRVLLNYSRFRQLIRYEIATDEYLIKPHSTVTPTIVREGFSTTSQTDFQLLGLAVQKKFFLTNFFLHNLYLQTGASASRELKTSQNLAMGMIGIGKSWPIAPHASLSLAPNLHVGLNSMKTNDDTFKNRFYQLGLSLELSFGKE